MGNRMVTWSMTSRDPLKGQKRGPNTLGPDVSKTAGDAI